MRVKDMTVGYPGCPLLGGVSFEVAPGECILLAGPNGSGKSTLVRTLAGLIPPLDGALPETRRTVLLPTGIPKVKGFSVRSFIRTSCYRESAWDGSVPPEVERRMEEAMAMLGIAGLASSDIATLSDGQFQLACIASALARQADVLLLDEPTAFLDVENRRLLLRSLKDLARRSDLSVLFSSHDLHESLRVADRVFACTGSGRLLVSESSPDACARILREVFPV